MAHPPRGYGELHRPNFCRSVSRLRSLRNAKNAEALNLGQCIAEGVERSNMIGARVCEQNADDRYANLPSRSQNCGSRPWQAQGKISARRRLFCEDEGHPNEAKPLPWRIAIMSKELYAAVDTFLAERLVGSDPVLDAVRKSCIDANLPAISVVPTYGKFLNLIARMLGARTILEIGTLAGYSTIWLARALPAGGRLVTLEADATHAVIARTNFLRAGLTNVIELREGPALTTLAQLAAAGHETRFDLIFIDADKPNNAAYFNWALKLARPGSLIIIDNVIRDERILDSGSTDPSIQSRRQLFTLLASEPRVSATALQTVDAKGHDGFAMALVL